MDNRLMEDLFQRDEEDFEIEEERPSELSTKKCARFVEIGKDKLSALYVGRGNHANDVGAIQADKPIPLRISVYYFEIFVASSGDKGKIAIGFTDSKFKTGRQPGWEANSYGYHGDDGKIFISNGIGELYGPTFSKNDVVGAGINLNTQELFFTLNGKFLGIGCKDVTGELFPTIGLHSTGEKVELNFGQKPFVFNIEAIIQEEKDRVQRQIDQVTIPANVGHSVVRAYLQHYGYRNTLEAFDSVNGCPSVPDSSMNIDSDPVLESLDDRSKIRQLIRNGDIDSARVMLEGLYPQILQDGRSILSFLLCTQSFIEMVTKGQVEEALQYARARLAPFRGLSMAHGKHLGNCLALLAYKSPSESPVGFLTHLNQREVVADAVNRIILLHISGENSILTVSTLEAILLQLTLCSSEKRISDGGQGELFVLKKAIRV